MKTLNEQLDARSGPLVEALRALSQCRTIEALRQAIRTQEPLVAEAERFADAIAPVVTREAAAFRDAVRIVRRTLAERKETLKGVAAPVAVQVVPSAPRKPEPPANAIVLSRAAGGDVRNYEKAKARAAAEHRPLWIE